MSEDTEIEIVSGDGSELDVSLVYDHLNATIPKTTKEKKQNLIIPKINFDDETKNNNDK